MFLVFRPSVFLRVKLSNLQLIDLGTLNLQHIVSLCTLYISSGSGNWLSLRVLMYMSEMSNCAECLLKIKLQKLVLNGEAACRMQG